jgi:hypothetical protein
MPSDPTPGAIQKDDDCAECAKRTTRDWLKIEGARELGQRDEWDWYCTGLPAEERAAGR